MAMLASCSGSNKSEAAEAFVGSCRPTRTAAWCAEFYNRHGTSAESYCSSFNGVFTLLHCSQSGRVAACNGQVQAGQSNSRLAFYLYSMSLDKARSICQSQQLEFEKVEATSG